MIVFVVHLNWLNISNSIGDIPILGPYQLSEHLLTFLGYGLFDLFGSHVEVIYFATVELVVEVQRDDVGSWNYYARWKDCENQNCFCY